MQDSSSSSHPAKAERCTEVKHTSRSKRPPKRRNFSQEREPGKQERPITTLMLRGIPCRLKANSLLGIVNEKGFDGLYDFFYMPCDRKGKSTLGYAFINLADEEMATLFEKKFNNAALDWRSSKVCTVVPAHIQGLELLEKHYCTSHALQSENPPIFFKGMPASNDDPETLSPEKEIPSMAEWLANDETECQVTEQIAEVVQEKAEQKTKKRAKKNKLIMKEEIEMNVNKEVEQLATAPEDREANLKAEVEYWEQKAEKLDGEAKRLCLAADFVFRFSFSTGLKSTGLCLAAEKVKSKYKQETECLAKESEEIQTEKVNKWVAKKEVDLQKQDLSEEEEEELDADVIWAITKVLTKEKNLPRAEKIRRLQHLLPHADHASLEQLLKARDPDEEEEAEPDAALIWAITEVLAKQKNLSRAEKVQRLQSLLPHADDAGLEQLVMMFESPEKAPKSRSHHSEQRKGSAIGFGAAQAWTFLEKLQNAAEIASFIAFGLGSSVKASESSLDDCIAQHAWTFWDSQPADFNAVDAKAQQKRGCGKGKKLPTAYSCNTSHASSETMLSSHFDLRDTHSSSSSEYSSDFAFYSVPWTQGTRHAYWHGDA